MALIEPVISAHGASLPPDVFRNLYVSSEFLRAVNPKLRQNDIRPSVAAPEEVLFPGLRLVVKELSMSHRYSPRHAITGLNSHILQRSVSDLAHEYAVSEVRLGDLVRSISRKLDYLSRPHTVARRSQQDLLLKVDLRNCRLLSAGSRPGLTVFEAQGWRSISLLADRLVIVLYAGDRSVPWMRNLKSRLFATHHSGD